MIKTASHSGSDEPERIDLAAEGSSLFGYCIECGEQFEVTVEEMSAFLNDEGDLLCIRCDPLALERPKIVIIKTLVER